MEPVEILEDAVLVFQHRYRLVLSPAGAFAAALALKEASVVGPPTGAENCRSICGPGLRLDAGRELIENIFQAIGRQVFVEIVIDLHHRRIHAGAEAFHFDPGEFAVRA